jgi:WD40 repeat protein
MLCLLPVGILAALLAGCKECPRSEGIPPDPSQGEKRIMLADKPAQTLQATGPGDYVAHLAGAAIPADQRTAAGLAFSPDSKTLAVRLAGGDLVQLWSVATHKLMHSLKSTHAVFAMQFSVKGQVLFTGYADGKVRLWDVDNGQLLETWDGLEKPVQSVEGMAASPDGKWLVSCGRLPTLWNLQTKKGAMLDVQLQDNFAQDLRHAAFSTDSRHFVTALKRLLVWDVGAGKVVKEAKGNAFAFCLDCAPDGKALVTGGGPKPFTNDRNGAVLQFWDLETAGEVGAVRGFADSVFCVAYCSDKKHLIAGGRSEEKGKEGCIYVWNLVTGTMKTVILYEQDTVFRLAVSPDGKWLAVAGYQRPGVRLYPLDSLLKKQ